jgi:regulatory protein
LAVRWRSRAELDRRLRRAGFDPEEVGSAIEDLEQAGLVDDARFARELVADRAGRRLAGNRAVRYALLAKGVAGDVAAQALEAAGDETERALALARKRAGRFAPSEPDAAYRRLYGLLVRRGFGPSVAREACRQALREALPEVEEPE